MWKGFVSYRGGVSCVKLYTVHWGRFYIVDENGGGYQSKLEKFKPFCGNEIPPLKEEANVSKLVEPIVRNTYLGPHENEVQFQCLQMTVHGCKRISQKD